MFSATEGLAVVWKAHIDLSAEHPGDISILKMCFMHLFVCILEFLLVFLIAERVLLRGRTSHLLVYVPKILHNCETFAHAVLQSGEPLLVSTKFATSQEMSVYSK